MVEMSGGGQAAAPLARRLYAETEGNPFFLIEIVKALFETGLVSLEDGVWRGDFARISEVGAAAAGRGERGHPGAGPPARRGTPGRPCRWPPFSAASSTLNLLDATWKQG